MSVPPERMTEDELLDRARKAMLRASALPVGSLERSVQWAVYDTYAGELFAYVTVTEGNLDRVRLGVLLPLEGQATLLVQLGLAMGALILNGHLLQRPLLGEQPVTALPLTLQPLL